MKNCTATLTSYFLLSKKVFLSVLLLTAFLNGYSQWSSTSGLPIAYWDFENNTTRTTLETTVEQQINSGNTFDGKFGGVSTTTSRRAGAGIDVYGGTADGSGLRAGGWSSSSTAGTGITTYFQFTINTTGFNGIRLNFDAFPVDGGVLVAPSFGVTYSTDGGTTYTNVGSQTTFGGAWYSDNSFTLGSGANNISNLKVRIYGYWSDNSTTSTLTIDNLVFNATSLSTSAGIKTTLNEPNIYTSYTSGLTGSLWIRYGTFTVSSGATLNMGSQIFLGSSSTAGAVTVNSGGTFDCGSGGSQTLSTGSSGLSTFNLNTGGTIVIRSTVGIAAAGTNSGNIQLTTRNFGAGGIYTYTHVSGSSQSSGTGLPALISGTLNINNNVTQTNAALEVTGPTNFTAGAFSIGAAHALTLGGAVTFGTGTISGTTTSDLTINGAGTITGNLVFTSGAQNLGNLTYSRAVTATLGSNLTVNLDFVLTAGTFTQNSGTNVFSLTVIGDFNLSGGTYNFHSGTTQSTLTLKGNFVHTTGSTTTSGSLNGIVLFNKAGTQTFSTALPASLVWIQYNIASGTTLQLLTSLPVYGSTSFPSACTVNGILDAGLFQVTSQATGCTFTLNSAATLITANTNGVFSTTVGTVSNTFTTRTFNNGAHYTFSGVAAQSTNFSNTTVGNLTINNSAGVNMTGSATVTGTIALTAGALAIGAGNTLTVSGPTNITAGTLSGTTTSDLIINGSGTFTGTLAYTSGAQQLQNFSLLRATPTLTMSAVSIAGNWVNNGTLTLSGTITFNGATSNTISGTSVTPFTSIIENKGTDNTNVLDVISPVTISTALTLTNGTFKWSNSGTVNLTTGTLTVGATTKLWVNGGSVKVGATSGSITLTGVLQVSAGTLNVGTLTGNSINYVAGSTILFDGGNVNVTGRIGRNTTTATTTYTQSAGTVTVVTIGSTSTSFAGFDIGAAGSSFTMSNGSIVLQGVTSNATDYLNIAGTTNVTGGTIQIGNGSTAAGSNFRVNSSVPFHNFTVNSFNTPRVTLVTNNLTANNTLTLNGGTITTAALRVIVPAAATVSRASGHVNGNFQMGFNTGSGQIKLFHVGDATFYTPVSLSSLDVTTAGSVTAFTAAGTNPSENSPITNSSGINQSARANRYWTLTSAGGFAMNATNATFGFDASEASGSTASYVVRKYSPTAWSTTTAGAMTSTSSSATGLTSLGEFEAGETTAAPGITCPSNITQCDNAVATWSPSFSGSPTPDVNCTPSSGSTFAVGTTPVNCNVANINGSANCSFSVTINTSPVISACPSNIVQCDNYTATWINPSSTGSPSPTIICNPASGSTFAAGTTTVNCSATNSCAASTCSFSVTVNESPVLSACPANIVQCDNHVATWTDPTSTGTPAAPVICVPASGSAFATGTTTVTCTSTNVCASSSCSFSVTINESSVDPSSASSNANYDEICLGSNVTLTVNGGVLGTGAQWMWYDGGCAAGISVGNGASLTLTPATAGLHNYYVRAEGVCGNTVCQNISVDVITAPPVGTIHNTASFSDGCVGAPANAISVNAIPGASFYRWTSAQAGVRFNGNPSPYETTIPTVNVTFVSLPASGGSGWSICAFAGNACGNSNTICTWVRAIVSMPGTIVGSVIGCPGSTGNPYSSPTVAGAASYQWSSTGGIVINNNGAQNVTLDFPAGFVSGTLSVHGQTSCGYNGPNRTMTVTAIPAIPGIITGPSYPCPNVSSVFSIAAVPGASSYTWSTNVVGAIVTGTTTSCSILFPASIPGGSTVSVVANTSCPTSSPIRSKGIATGVPNVPAVINGLASGQCGQQGVSYSISPVSLATSYNWTTTCGTITGPNNLSAISLNWPSSFTVCTLAVSASNSCGTSGVRILAVTGAPAIPPGISGNASPCANTVESYSTTGSTGATSYTWTVPAGALILGPANGATISVLWGSTSGNITVRATNDCGNSAIRTLACSISCRMNQVNSSSSFSAEVFPNPATAQATVRFTSETASRYRLTMANMLGKNAFISEGEAKEGMNIIDMNLSSLSKGIYLLTLESGNHHWQQKFTVD